MDAGLILQGFREVLAEANGLCTYAPVKKGSAKGWPS